MTVDSGQRLSHYRLLEQVGEGGMGVVWKAVDTVLGRTVAVKVLNPAVVRNERRREMFLQEARRASTLSHPNVTQVYEFGRDAGLDFLAMEYVEGEPLGRLLHGRSLAPREVADFGRQIAEALAEAHRKNLVHRDLKPGNVLVTADRQVKVVDFGLATLARPEDALETASLTRPSAVTRAPADDQPRKLMGTLQYMSPEQVRLEELDARSDIFSLGALLYEMTTGALPFSGQDSQQLLQSIVRCEPLPVHRHDPKAPFELDRIIRKAMARQRGDRYQSMDDLAVDLKRLGQDLETGSSPSYEDLTAPAVAPGAEPTGTRLAVLLFTDITSSAELKAGLGSVAYGRLVARHDTLFGDIVRSVAGAAILRDTGNGYLARFNAASEAVTAALLFHHAMRSEPAEPGRLQVRVGIHTGEVDELPSGATHERKVVGLAVDTARQVMELGLPGQVLMTRTAFEDARQYVRGYPAATPSASSPDLEWMAHGPYLFEGNDEAINIFEVGGVGVAPLQPPPDSDRSRRAVAADEEITLGWRPATGLEIPARKGWRLEEKLGQGGFGEVWLASHQKTGDQRTFKFCFDAGRLRSFKRELTLFRILRQVLGERVDIARIHEIQVEQPPFYLECEFTRSGNLSQWAERRGGILHVPLATRLDLVARTAEAVAAAHSVGVLHKDIKPSNILVYEEVDGAPRPRLADFGIGVLADRSHLDRYDITMTGFTETGLMKTDTTGTRMYAPPEAQVGKPFTIQADVYALGVLLYQMVVGDLKRPLGMGWERDVEDRVLREDIAICVDHDPDTRLGNAVVLAQRLRDVEVRRRQMRRAARRRLTARVGTALAAVAVIVTAGWTIHSQRIRQEQERASVEQERASVEQARAQQASEAARLMTEFLEGMFEEAYAGKDGTRGLTAGEFLDIGARNIREGLDDQPLVRAEFMTTMGNVYRSRGEYEEALSLLEEALRIRVEELGEDHVDVAQTLNNLAGLLYHLGNAREGWGYQDRAMSIQERLLGPAHPDLAEALWNHAGMSRAHGDWAGAEELYQRALALLETGPPAEYAFARARYNARVGKRDEALRFLLKAFDEGYAGEGIVDDPEFATLRDDPAFKTILLQRARPGRDRDASD